jgi:hypothetical protein
MNAALYFGTSNMPNILAINLLMVIIGR